MRYVRQSTATVIEVGPFIDETDGKTLEDALTVANIDVQLMQPVGNGVVPPDLVQNGDMSSGTGWTVNSWTISGGVANSASAQDTNLDQTLALTENIAYEVVYEVKTRSAGSCTAILGGVSGTARSTAAIFTETIVAGSGSLIRFDAIGFTGTIDDVVIKQVPLPITPAASGSTNDMVLTQSNTGTYWLELTANQVGIVGRHKLTAWITGALIVWEDFMVVEEAVWDSLYATSAAPKQGINAMLDTTVAVVNSQTDFDLTAGSGDADAYLDGVVVFEDSDGDQSFRRATDYIVSGNNLIIDSAADFTVVAGDIVRIYPASIMPTAAQIADQVWDELQSEHVTVGSFGIIASEIADTLVDTAVIGALGVGLSNIPWSADWDVEVQSEVADALAVYNGPTSAELVTEIDAVQTDVAAVKGVVDAIKVPTDKLVFTVANQLDANVQYINDAAVTGDGNASPWDGA